MQNWLIDILYKNHVLQWKKLIEEANHGMFSYFLMKGMEGEADANNDNQITAGELHAYVEQNAV